MPTGYTAPIEKGISFREFVLNCARAFISRDDKAITDDVKPSEYHSNELKKLQQELRDLHVMTVEEADIRAHKEYSELKNGNETFLKNKDELRKKYDLMLVEVIKWCPPTHEHDALKEFMIDQIQKSINFDCGDYSHILQEPCLLPPLQWINKERDRIFHDIKYHTKEDNEERERVALNNKWVRDLKECLKE